MEVICRQTEGHDVVGGESEVRVEGQGRSDSDARCQLAMTEQQLAAVKRHLAESRRENDDLLKAVAYLRNKLHALEDTPTNLHANDNNDVTSSTAAAAEDDDVDDDEYEDDDELCSESSPTELGSCNSELRSSDLCMLINVYLCQLAATTVCFSASTL